MPLQFLFPLHKATRQLTVYLESDMNGLGMSPQEGHILTYLYRYAPAPVGELVRVFGIKQSTLTSVLDRLETAGFLRRTLNPDDRRSFLIHITDAGHTVAEQSNQRLEALETDIRARVTDRDMDGFEAVMRAISEVAQVRLRDR